MIKHIAELIMLKPAALMLLRLSHTRALVGHCDTPISCCEKFSYRNIHCLLKCSYRIIAHIVIKDANCNHAYITDHRSHLTPYCTSCCFLWQSAPFMKLIMLSALRCLPKIIKLWWYSALFAFIITPDLYPNMLRGALLSLNGAQCSLPRRRSQEVHKDRLNENTANEAVMLPTVVARLPTILHMLVTDLVWKWKLCSL